MDELIAFVGRDNFVMVTLYIGTNIRAGKPKRMPIVQGLILAFTPFFVVACLLYLLEWGLGMKGLEIPTKPMAAMAGLGGFLGNSWLIGLAKDAKRIERKGAVGSLLSIIRSIGTFKKP